MTQSSDWPEEQFFEVPTKDFSSDGGTTSSGPLWHAVSTRWGHAMHALCSYQGMYPPKLVHYFLQKYSEPGQTILDPFGGRGTTTLQARVEQRAAIGNDLSPLAYVLSKAKASPPSWPEIMGHIDRLEEEYSDARRSKPEVSDDIRMLYREDTLEQLWFLRSRLLEANLTQWNVLDSMVAAGIAGILHGTTREDGTSSYLSISMPNTFSMSPTYVRRYIAENGLEAPEQNVFDRLRDKLAFQYLDSNAGPDSVILNGDAGEVMRSDLVAEKADLIITSPPYLKVVNYGTSNWIRLWWLGVDDVSTQAGAGRRELDSKLDHAHGYDKYEAFMLDIFKGASKALTPDGVAVFVIGDVASPGRESLPLAQTVWEKVGSKSGLHLLDFIEDDLPAQKKVSRIWGETRGQATNRDCILVLARKDGSPSVVRSEIEWFEPYRDAGPDAAHAHARKRRQEMRDDLKSARVVPKRQRDR